MTSKQRLPSPNYNNNTTKFITQFNLNEQYKSSLSILMLCLYCILRHAIIDVTLIQHLIISINTIFPLIVIYMSSGCYSRINIFLLSIRSLESKRKDIRSIWFSNSFRMFSSTYTQSQHTHTIHPLKWRSYHQTPSVCLPLDLQFHSVPVHAYSFSYTR